MVFGAFFFLTTLWIDIMAIQPTPPGPRTPPRNKGLIAGLIKGNQWLISP